MSSLEPERRSNGYSTRRFFMGCYSQSTSAFGTLSPASGVSGSIVWCPVTKKYYSGELDGSGAKVYSRTPGGIWTLVHTGSGNGVGLFWSRRLGMLVYFTSTHIYTSVDGTNWVSRTVPASYAPTAMHCFADANTYSVFVATDTTSYMYVTTNGSSWTRVQLLGTTGISRCGCIDGSDTILFAKEDSSSGNLRYTTDGLSTTAIVSSAAMYGYFPPTPLRQEHWYINSTTAYRSTDGVSFSDASCPIRTGSFDVGRTLAFAGVMSSMGSSAPPQFDFLNYAQTSKVFSDVANTPYAGSTASAQISTQGEFLSQNYYTTGWNPRPVGTWLEPGDTMCLLVGGGGQNVATNYGGNAGCMVRHKFTVTEKHRWIAYNIAGAAAIVDVGGSDGLQRDEFLAYASFPSFSTDSRLNVACFGDEVYYGMPALQQTGAACGPSGGYPAYRGLSSTSFGCGTSATTTATTPNDWWDPEDWVGNPSGTGYPGTSGGSLATNGLFAAAQSNTGSDNSYGAGARDASTAFGQRGGQPLLIIYSR